MTRQTMSEKIRDIALSCFSSGQMDGAAMAKALLLVNSQEIFVEGTSTVASTKVVRKLF